MKIGPKYKICKRLGSAIFEKCQSQKYALSEARSAAARKGGRRGRPGAASEYKRQLIEKQKMRFSYGITERQLSRYVRESMSKEGDPAKVLMTRLETRLDNIVYRLGVAKTRRLARQLVSHGHITVNGRKVTIPSYQVRASDVVAVRPGSRGSALFANLAEETAEQRLPAWIRFDGKQLEGSMVGEPQVDDLTEVFDPVQVLEYYSR